MRGNYLIVEGDAVLARSDGPAQIVGVGQRVLPLVAGLEPWHDAELQRLVKTMVVGEEAVTVAYQVVDRPLAEAQRAASLRIAQAIEAAKVQRSAASAGQLAVYAAKAQLAREALSGSAEAQRIMAIEAEARGLDWHALADVIMAKAGQGAEVIMALSALALTAPVRIAAATSIAELALVVRALEAEIAVAGAPQEAS